MTTKCPNCLSKFEDAPFCPFCGGLLEASKDAGKSDDRDGSVILDREELAKALRAMNKTDPGVGGHSMCHVSPPPEYAPYPIGKQSKEIPPMCYAPPPPPPLPPQPQPPPPPDPGADEYDEDDAMCYWSD